MIRSIGITIAIVAVATVFAFSGEEEPWEDCFENRQQALRAGDTREDAVEQVREVHARHLALVKKKRREVARLDQHSEWGAPDFQVGLAAATVAARIELGKYEEAAGDTGDTMGCLEGE